MKKWRTFKRKDRPVHSPYNIATMIREDEEITSNDVVPVVEDIYMPPAVLNLKSSGQSRENSKLGNTAFGNIGLIIEEYLEFVTISIPQQKFF